MYLDNVIHLISVFSYMLYIVLNSIYAIIVL